MFWPDINTIRNFYLSPLGNIAIENIAERIFAIWPDIKQVQKAKSSEYVAGIGYACPYFSKTINVDDKTADNVLLQNMFCIMPAAQGASFWPKNYMNRTLLAKEYELPFADEQFDKILIIHALEHTNDTRHFMREIWRVLKPNGKIIIIVPNRIGLWAHAEHTPFGSGKTFSTEQLKVLLTDGMFKPTNFDTALHFFPSQFSFVQKLSSTFDKFGRKFFKPCGGIVIAEATKQLYAATPDKVSLKSKKLVAAVD